jgi:AcrR family transcriptional regulator
MCWRRWPRDYGLSAKAGRHRVRFRSPRCCLASTIPGAAWLGFGMPRRDCRKLLQMSDPSQDETLNARQLQAVSALLSEPTIGKAADRAGVSVRTLYSWLHDDAAFIATYQDARRQAVQQAIAQLQKHSSDAVSVLVSIMKNTSKPPAVRIAAASKVLDLAIKGVELEDLAARLEALEQAYAKH